jgi:hypothetical protein
MTCRGCEQRREAFFEFWRRTLAHKQPSCVVKGCAKVGAPICRVHWRMLSIQLRKRWWSETNYDNQPPPQMLIDEINRAILEAQKPKTPPA